MARGRPRKTSGTAQSLAAQSTSANTVKEPWQESASKKLETPSTISESQLQLIKGVWIPASEKHLLLYADRENWTYQLHKLQACLPYLRKADLVVDVGGHCGIWAKELEKVFDQVVSFEPVALHRECYKRNTKRAKLMPYALGEKESKVSIHTTPDSTGDSWVTGEGDIEMRTLDSFDLAPDMIKIDCEGYELFVLKGAVETIKKHKPIIIVEQKPGKADLFGIGQKDAVTFLKSLGMKLKKEISGDFILTW